MPRQRPLPKRLDRSRIQTHIKGDVHERVDLYCAHYGLTESQFFEAAAVEKLEGTGDAKELKRQLNLLSQQLEIISEHGNLFLQMWLQHTPPLPKSERDATRRPATAAYHDFLRQIATNLSGGRGFLRGYTKDHLTSKLARGNAQAAPARPQPNAAAAGGPSRG
jgi:hypothetical protein